MRPSLLRRAWAGAAPVGIGRERAGDFLREGVLAEGEQLLCNGAFREQGFGKRGLVDEQGADEGADGEERGVALEKAQGGGDVFRSGQGVGGTQENPAFFELAGRDRIPRLGDLPCRNFVGFETRNYRGDAADPCVISTAGIERGQDREQRLTEVFRFFSRC